MALEQVFKRPEVRAKLRAGMLGDLIEAFCQWLLGHGFSQVRIRTHIWNVIHFDVYLAQRSTLPLKIVRSEDVYSFLKEYPSTLAGQIRGKAHKRCIRYSLSRFVEYLREAELFDSSPRQETYQPLLDAYLEWMRTYRHVAVGTIEMYRYLLVKFLTWLGPKANIQGLSRLSSEEVERFFLQYAQGIGQSRRHSMQGALRMFFRFCLHRGYIKRPLEQAVPALRTYRLATLPRGLTEAQAQEVLKCPDLRTDAGRRDYAILQLLYTYGVRCGQVRALRLEDINWAENQILFRATKHGKDSLLPITVDVGESLLYYLRHARPRYPYSEVFLTCCAPYRPFGSHLAISSMVARHITRAGIDIPHKGAHVFRHGFATRMLQKGNPLKSISDVLGHRNLQTTFIYTKVDFNALNQVALEWPQEVK